VFITLTVPVKGHFDKVSVDSITYFDQQFFVFERALYTEEAIVFNFVFERALYTEEAIVFMNSFSSYVSCPF